LTGSVFGLLNINKPPGPTSHDIVAGVRRGIKERRVGHTGTLDPMAEGVLVVALGEATRLVEYMAASDKTYLAEITLGFSTQTYDGEGAIVARRDVPADLTPENIEAMLRRFRGPIMQVPPVYSAVKVGGKPAHTRARAGETVALAPRQVTIHQLLLVSWEPPIMRLEVECSAGTYIRSLAHDLGEALGCGATLTRLIRTRSGNFYLVDAIPWPTLGAAFADGSWPRYVLPPDRALSGQPRMVLQGTELQRVAHGLPIPNDRGADGLVRGYTPSGRFVAVLRGDPHSRQWRPVKVFRNAAQG